MNTGCLVRDKRKPYNLGVVLAIMLCNETNDWNREMEYTDILALEVLWPHGLETVFEFEVSTVHKNEK